MIFSILSCAVGILISYKINNKMILKLAFKLKINEKYLNIQISYMFVYPFYLRININFHIRHLFNLNALKF